MVSCFRRDEQSRMLSADFHGGKIKRFFLACANGHPLDLNFMRHKIEMTCGYQLATCELSPLAGTMLVFLAFMPAGTCGSSTRTSLGRVGGFLSGEKATSD
jgi:hypothetical protein